VAYEEETAEEQRARYEREWNELCRRMRQATRQLGGLARHATLEARLRASQARLKVYQDVLEYFVEAPELVPYEGSERARDAIIEGIEAAAKVLRQSPLAER
jgi:hypothetical protein